jgi:hypothetical protein
VTENKPGVCPNCGKKAGAEDDFCSFCGKALTGEQEPEPNPTELKLPKLDLNAPEKDIYSYGPSGIMIVCGRPSFFCKGQNRIRVFLTNKRIYAIASFRNKLRFQAPYESVVSCEVVTFNKLKGIYIKYIDGQKIDGMSILADKKNYGHIARTLELLLEASKNNRTTDSP